VLQKTRIERQKLEASLELDRDLKNGGVKVLGKGRQRGQRTVFVDSVGEQQAFGEENSRKSETRLADSESEEDDHVNTEDSGAEDEAQKLRRTERERRLKLLEAIKKRERELVVADNELELQRAKMTNSIGGTNKNGVKYKIRERKR
jgi:U3 small nucleolar RNA-associated protein 11